MGASNYVHLEDCDVKHVTEKAVLIAYNGEDHWIPKNQIDGEGANLDKGDVGITISITEWIARQKQLD